MEMEREEKRDRCRRRRDSEGEEIGRERRWRRRGKWRWKDIGDEKRWIGRDGEGEKRGSIMERRGDGGRGEEMEKWRKMRGVDRGEEQ